jgi:hypothetical protein
MRRSRGRAEDGLVVHRRYERSRHEEQFAAAAYEIVLPQITRALAVDFAQAREGTQRLCLAVDSRARRPA